MVGLTTGAGVVAALAVGLSGHGGGRFAVALDGKALPAGVVLNNARADATVRDGKPALRVGFGKAEWPNIGFKPEQGVWDWSGSSGLSVDVFNAEKEPVAFAVRVDNDGADGWNHCNTAHGTAKPGSWTTVALGFRVGEPARRHGER